MPNRPRRERNTVRSAVYSALRYLRLGRLGFRTGTDLAVAKARKVFASAERRIEIDERVQLRTAEAVRDALGDMKGAFMKVGQMASYIDQGLPEHVREVLGQLQSSAPPMSGDLAASVIAEELGEVPEVLFDSWDPYPLAAASIGQVHRAVTRDGRAVAVKVQYPGAAEAIRSDMATAGTLFAALARAFPGLEPGPIVAELAERITEELDYRIEASNQQRFTDAYRGHPTIHVPGVHPDLSSRRVLTTELVLGNDFATAKTWSDTERNLAAETIYRFAFGSLYRLQLFNGDPHPGNYLFHGDGRVSFLDFGLVKRFETEELMTLQRMVKAMVVDHDLGTFRADLAATGLLRDPWSFSDEQIEGYFGHFYEIPRRAGVSTITGEYSSDTVRRMFMPGGEHGEVTRAANVPPSFVILQRINLGLMAVFGELEATADWRAISEEIWPFVDAPPSTPMGHKIREWERSRALSGRAPHPE